MNLQVFQKDGKELRTEIIEGEPWFLVKDVCEILEIRNRSDASKELAEEDKRLSEMTTPGGNQKMLFVNEPGLYDLVIKSRKPEAKIFKRWILKEVLPSIRKTGSYSVANHTSSTSLTTQANDLTTQANDLTTQVNQKMMIETLLMQSQQIQANLQISMQLIDKQEQQQKQIQLIAGDLNQIKENQRLAKLELEKEEPSDMLPLEVSTRKKIGRLVKNWAALAGEKVEFAWKKLYQEFYDRYGVNVYVRAANLGKVNKLDVVEELGMVKDLHALASYLFQRN